MYGTTSDVEREAMATRERELCAQACRFFHKRNNGAWYRGALHVLVSEIRAARRELASV